MTDDFASPAADGSWNGALSEPTGHPVLGETKQAGKIFPVGIQADNALPALARPGALHPLDRPDGEDPDFVAESIRIRLAWTKLLWLLAFLAVLLGVSYLVPFVAENVQYSLTRGRQRAEHDIALQHIGNSPLVDLSRANQMISQVVEPSVVHINTQGSETDLLAFRMRGSRSGRTPTEGQGSGFIVDTSGHILTNYHVIRDAREIQVSLADGRKVTARLIGADKETDLALLKVNAEGLTPARWGDSSEMRTGALVWAVGSPFGLERSITSGIISGRNRAGLAGTAYQDFLQTDAAVNPGNSGGPLVNTSGEVVGINTAIVGEAFQGISFAVPSNVARDVAERLKGEGLVLRGWLGVQLEDMTEQHAKDLGLAEKTGAYIAAVVNNPVGGSPAAQAGILPGDVILRWNDSPVTGPASLSTQVAKTEIGSTATALVFRDGKEVQVEVLVGQRPEMP